jgi:hypothetical protein
VCILQGVNPVSCASGYDCYVESEAVVTVSLSDPHLIWSRIFVWVEIDFDVRAPASLCSLSARHRMHDRNRDLARGYVMRTVGCANKAVPSNYLPIFDWKRALQYSCPF